MAGRAAEAANRSVLLGGHVRREGVEGRSGEKGTKTWGRARRVRAGAGGGWSGAEAGWRRRRGLRVGPGAAGVGGRRRARARGRGRRAGPGGARGRRAAGGGGAGLGAHAVSALPAGAGEARGGPLPVHRRPARARRDPRRPQAPSRRRLASYVPGKSSRREAIAAGGKDNES